MNDSNELPLDPSYVDLEAHMVRAGRIRKKKHSRGKRPDSRWPRKRRRW